MVKINVCIKKVHLTGVSSEPYLCVCVGRGVDVSEREDEIYGKGGRLRWLLFSRFGLVVEESKVLI